MCPFDFSEILRTYAPDRIRRNWKETVLNRSQAFYHVTCFEKQNVQTKDVYWAKIMKDPMITIY